MKTEYIQKPWPSLKKLIMVFFKNAPHPDPKGLKTKVDIKKEPPPSSNAHILAIDR